MADILKHPLLMKCYVLMGDIEQLGPGEKQTAAIVKASELMEAIDKAVSETSDPFNGV